MSCDVDEVTERLENQNELWPRWSDWKLREWAELSVTSPTSQLILQPFRRFTYVTTHSPTLPLLHLRHISFSNPYVAWPTSQLILQSFHCFIYVTAHSLTLLFPHVHHRHFTYVTWLAVHDTGILKFSFDLYLRYPSSYCQSLCVSLVRTSAIWNDMTHPRNWLIKKHMMINGPATWFISLTKLKKKH